MFKNTLEMKSLVYGTHVTLLMVNSRMSFSASGLLPLRVSINYDNIPLIVLFLVNIAIG